MVKPGSTVRYATNSEVVYMTMCFECRKKYGVKTEKERKLKDRLHKKVCPNGKLVMII